MDDGLQYLIVASAIIIGTIIIFCIISEICIWYTRRRSYFKYKLNMINDMKKRIEWLEYMYNKDFFTRPYYIYRIGINGEFYFGFSQYCPDKPYSTIIYDDNIDITTLDKNEHSGIFYHQETNSYRRTIEYKPIDEQSVFVTRQIYSYHISGNSVHASHHDPFCCTNKQNEIKIPNLVDFDIVSSTISYCTLDNYLKPSRYHQQYGKYRHPQYCVLGDITVNIYKPVNDDSKRSDDYKIDICESKSADTLINKPNHYLIDNLYKKLRKYEIDLCNEFELYSKIDCKDIILTILSYI